MIAKKIIYFVVLAVAVAACSSIDCPMNSHVYAKYGFYKAGNVAMPLTDSLTVSINRMDGNDTILLNKLTNVHDMQLPLSYLNETDTLYFAWGLTNKTHVTDTLYVEKSNDKHFESVECGANYFHTLKSISCTHNLIDSVKIKQDKVNYDVTQEHIFIYLNR